MAVELKGQYTYGMTVCDHRHLRVTGGELDTIGKVVGESPNAEVGMQLDVVRFFDIIDRDDRALSITLLDFSIQVYSLSSCGGSIESHVVDWPAPPYCKLTN